jgi:hypothetical protein
MGLAGVKQATRPFGMGRFEPNLPLEECAAAIQVEI